MASSNFTRKELNSLKATSIVVNTFPSILRNIFKQKWLEFTGIQWIDDHVSGQEFMQRESIRNRARNRDKLRKVVYGDSAQFDCTVLFYCILFSNSVGSLLWSFHRGLYRVVDKLRRLRNEHFHRPSLGMTNRELYDFIKQVKRSFRALGCSVKEVDEIRRKSDFSSREVERIRRHLSYEKRKSNNYENYFSWKAEYFQEFSNKYNNSIGARTLQKYGVLTEKEAARVDSERNTLVKNAIIVDCVLQKGLRATSTFFTKVQQSDTSLATAFRNILPLELLQNLTTISPVLTRKASCDFPKNYKAIMSDFTQCIYQMDWALLDQRAQLYEEQSTDPTVKLFIKIELAYGYNVRGDSQRALQLLDEVIPNAATAGSNCNQIVARTYARKSLHCIHVCDLDKAYFYATEANALISNSDCPEEQIVCLKRLTDCILYEDGTVKERVDKSAPLYSKMIDMCHSYINDIPRCLYYLRFIYHDMARLCLGFTKHGFIESTTEEIEQGLKYIDRLEQPDLKTQDESTYTDAFRFICKSLAALKIAGKKREKNMKNRGLQGRSQRIGFMVNEGLQWRDKATAICNSLKGDNNEAMFMLDSLNDYIVKLRI